MTSPFEFISFFTVFWNDLLRGQTVTFRRVSSQCGRVSGFCLTCVHFCSWSNESSSKWSMICKLTPPQQRQCYFSPACCRNLDWGFSGLCRCFLIIWNNTELCFLSSQLSLSLVIFLQKKKSLVKILLLSQNQTQIITYIAIFSMSCSRNKCALPWQWTDLHKCPLLTWQAL